MFRLTTIKFFRLTTGNKGFPPMSSLTKMALAILEWPKMTSEIGRSTSSFTAWSLSGSIFRFSSSSTYVLNCYIYYAESSVNGKKEEDYTFSQIVSCVDFVDDNLGIA